MVQRFLKDRNENAFRNLYRSKSPALYQMALRLTAYDPYKSEEILQEMWIMAIKRLPDFEWRSTLSTWLTGILINIWRERRRSNERELAALSAMESRTDVSNADLYYTKYDLEKAIISLPPGYRQVIVLHDIEGYKHREIAMLLDIEEGTSKSQLHHARKAMRIFLKDEIKDEES